MFCVSDLNDSDQSVFSEITRLFTGIERIESDLAYLKFLIFPSGDVVISMFPFGTYNPPSAIAGDITSYVSGDWIISWIASMTSVCSSSTSFASRSVDMIIPPSIIHGENFSSISTYFIYALTAFTIA